MLLSEQQIREILKSIAIMDMLDSYDAGEVYGYKKGINKLLSILGYEPNDIIDDLYSKHCDPLCDLLFTKKLSRVERLQILRDYFDKMDVSLINKINS